MLENANKDPKKIQEVLDTYDKALDYYEMDKNSNEAKVNKVKEAKADLITLYDIKEEISRAKAYYEDLAYYYLKSNSGRVYTIEYFAKLVMIYLLYDDYITARAFLNKYYGEDKNFHRSDIAHFLENLIRCFENDGQDIKDEDLDTEDNIYITHFVWNF